MRGSGKVKPAKFKRSWFRVSQNPYQGERLVERTFTNGEGKDYSVGRPALSSNGARSSKGAKEVRVILKDHRNMIKAERKRLRTLVTLQDLNSFHRIRRGINGHN